MTRLDTAPRCVHSLVWCLAALHFRSGKKFAGATYAALHKILGTSSRSGLRRSMRYAEALKLVVVDRLPPNAYGAQVGTVRLTKSALRMVELSLEEF